MTRKKINKNKKYIINFSPGPDKYVSEDDYISWLHSNLHTPLRVMEECNGNIDIVELHRLIKISDIMCYNIKNNES